VEGAAGLGAGRREADGSRSWRSWHGSSLLLVLEKEEKTDKGERKVSVVIPDVEIAGWRSCYWLVRGMVAVSGWNGGEREEKWQNN